MRTTKNFRPILGEKLEDRTVPSTLGLRAIIGPHASLPGGGTSTPTSPTSTPTPTGHGGNCGGGGLGGLLGGLGHAIGGLLGGDHEGRGGGFGGGASSTGAVSTLLNQDAQAVRSAFQAFDASALSAVAQLRQTVTSGAPSQAGLTAFNTAISNAISGTNGLIPTITKDLSNLSNTGASLVSTLTAPATSTSPGGAITQLLANVESAATGLTSNSNSAVLAMDREIAMYIQSALGQTTTAILTDAPAGVVTGGTLRTYQQATGAAYSQFRSDIAKAESAAISASAALDPTAAIGTLQASLDKAITGLGLASANDPTSTVNGLLSTLQTTLSALKPGTSTRAFTHAVTAAIQQAEQAINTAVLTAIQANDNSLL